MSTELSLPDKIEYAKALAPSQLLPVAYRGKPESVLLAMEYGDALGLAPMVAINNVHIIEGKPSLSAGVISALIRKAGHKIRTWVSTDDSGDPVGITTIHRADDPGFEYRSEWTKKRANAAGLWGKGNWSKYPENMLKSRSITDCGRDACQDVLLGFGYTPDELGAEVDETGALIPEVVHQPAPKTPPAARRARGIRERAAAAAHEAHPPVNPTEPGTTGNWSDLSDDDQQYISEILPNIDTLERLRDDWREWTHPAVRKAIEERTQFVQRMQLGEPVDATLLDAEVPA